jgi:glycosyltransferase involved in cell wall biosynthesis
MRILFQTEHVDDCSTMLNQPNFARLNEIEGVHIDFFRKDYENYDVVLFMGYDPKIEDARKIKPSLKIGVVDARPPNLASFKGADFIVANGIEMRDWLADFFSNIYIYHIYPVLEQKTKQHEDSGRIVIGYHGNKEHLLSMRPIVTTALGSLAEDYEVELRLVYNVRELGPLPDGWCDDKKVRISAHQWSERVYEEQMADVDIGIVPGFDYVGDNERGRVTSVYKNTSNAGRLMVFGQYAIPVVADMYPSAAGILRDGTSGFLVRSAGGWYRALKELADSAETRSRMGRSLQEDFRKLFAVDVMNRGFIDFLHNLDPDPEPSGASDFSRAKKELHDPGAAKPGMYELIRGFLGTGRKE